MRDLNVPEELVLAHGHHAALEEVEDGKEIDDDHLRGGVAVQELTEAQVPHAAHQAVHGGHSEGHRQALGRDVLRLQKERLAAAVYVRADDGKASQADALEVVGHEVQELGVRTTVRGSMRPSASRRAPSAAPALLNCL